MRDGDFHLNVLKRLEDLESSRDTQRQHVGDLEATVIRLEGEVDTLEHRTVELAGEIESLRVDVENATDGMG